MHAFVKAGKLWKEFIKRSLEVEKQALFVYTDNEDDDR
jgi:hypothetical protein